MSQYRFPGREERAERQAEWERECEARRVAENDPDPMARMQARGLTVDKALAVQGVVDAIEAYVSARIECHGRFGPHVNELRQEAEKAKAEMIDALAEMVK